MAAIPWGEDIRALYAVGYPGGPIEDIIIGETFHEIDECIAEDSSEDDWASLERQLLARQSLVIRTRENPTLSDATEDTISNGATITNISTVNNSATPTVTTARVNSTNHSHSRGRSGTRVADSSQQLQRRIITRTRNSLLAPAVSSSRGTRSAGGIAGDRRKPRHTDGCIVVAASDETVRFHEVWSDCRKGVIGWRGVLGGSDILEGLEGIEKDGGETIR